MKSESFVSVVSATLNEKGNVLDLIDTINAATKDFPHELSIVNDNSSGEIMSRFVEGRLVIKRNPLRSYARLAAIALCQTLLTPTRKYRDPISGYFAFDRGVNAPYDKIFELFEGRIAYKTLIPILTGNADKKSTEVPFYFWRRYWGESKIITENFLSRYISELNSYRVIFRERVS